MFLFILLDSGVVGFYCARDLSGSPPPQKEELFIETLIRGGGYLLKAKRFVVILDPLVAEHHVLSVGDI